MEQRCRHPPQCKRVPSKLGYWDSATRRWRNATVVASCWKWKEEMVNGTYHQPQMTSLLSLPRGGPIGKTVNKSVVTWGTYTFIAELNVWGRCKELFCLFLWSSPVFFDLTWCQRIASTSPRNYKYWSSWRLGVKWREGLKCPSKIGRFSLCHQSCSYWSICFSIKPCGTFDVAMNGFLNFQKNWYFFVISRFSDVIILIQMNGG